MTVVCDHCGVNISFTDPRRCEACGDEHTLRTKVALAAEEFGLNVDWCRDSGADKSMTPGEWAHYRGLFNELCLVLGRHCGTCAHGPDCEILHHDSGAHTGPMRAWHRQRYEEGRIDRACPGWEKK